MKSILTILTLLVAVAPFYSQKKITGSYEYKTECLGVELDGSQSLKAWGYGRSKTDAVEQAKKNAVKDVIFNGIHEGKQDCSQKALLTVVNAQEKYETYFSKFFADGGEYLSFISIQNKSIFSKKSKNNKKVREGFVNGIVLNVLRNELKNKLIADGIIK